MALLNGVTANICKKSANVQFPALSNQEYRQTMNAGKSKVNMMELFQAHLVHGVEQSLPQ